MTDAIPEVAKGKIGKFPVWVVALVLVGGLGAVYYFYSRSSGANSSASTTATTGSDTGYSTSGIPDSSSDSSSDSGGDSTSTATAGTSALVSTNSAWLARATAGVTAAFFASPVTVFNVLSNFLDGGSYLQSQQKYVDRALNDYGLPPEGVVGIADVTPDPATGSSASTVSTGTATTGTTTGTGSGSTTIAPPKVTTTPAKPAVTQTVNKQDGAAEVKKVNAAADGEKFTLSKVHKYYLTAKLASTYSGALGSYQPGSYYVTGKTKVGSQVMMKLSKSKSGGFWINP